ncbi:MAG: DnaA regulatory inactivator Hda, partial [Gammaproteobacteria bacterium]|nr:DnaA regulatory inactivator Hda [Gammaproteobacteria bacterium]
VCDFILLRSDRSMPGLMSVLQKLDDASLERKRRVTVPLIKEIMNW